MRIPSYSDICRPGSGISMNHVVTVFFALVGGIVFDRFGAGVLFAFASAMALANSAFALTIPKPE